MTADFTIYLERWQYVRPCGHDAGGWSLCQHKPQPLTYAGFMNAVAMVWPYKGQELDNDDDV